MFWNLSAPERSRRRRLGRFPDDRASDLATEWDCARLRYLAPRDKGVGQEYGFASLAEGWQMLSCRRFPNRLGVCSRFLPVKRSRSLCDLEHPRRRQCREFGFAATPGEGCAADMLLTATTSSAASNWARRQANSNSHAASNRFSHSRTISRKILLLRERLEGIQSRRYLTSPTELRMSMVCAPRHRAVPGGPGFKVGRGVSCPAPVHLFVGTRAL